MPKLHWRLEKILYLRKDDCSMVTFFKKAFLIHLFTLPFLQYHSISTILSSCVNNCWFTKTSFVLLITQSIWTRKQEWNCFQIHPSNLVCPDDQCLCFCFCFSNLSPDNKHVSSFDFIHQRKVFTI